MSSPISYSTTEILLLLQSLAIHGTDITAFTRTSELLTSNVLIKEASHYNPAHFTIDALRILFLRTLRQELQADTANRPASDAPKRPNTPPPSTLQEAARYKARLPQFVTKYHLQFKEETIGAIRDGEKRFEVLQREVDEIERGEWDSRITKDALATKLSRQDSHSAVGKLGRQNSYSAADRRSRNSSFDATDKDRLRGASATPRGSPHLLRAIPSKASPRPEGIAISDVLNSADDNTSSQLPTNGQLPIIHQETARPPLSRTPSTDRTKAQYPPQPKEWQWNNHFQNGQNQQYHAANRSYGQHPSQAVYDQHAPSTHRGSLNSSHVSPVPTPRTSISGSQDYPRHASHGSPSPMSHVILPPPHAMQRGSMSPGLHADVLAEAGGQQQYRTPGPQSPLAQQSMNASTPAQHSSQFVTNQPSVMGQSRDQRSPHWPQYPTYPQPPTQYTSGFVASPLATASPQLNQSRSIARPIRDSQPVANGQNQYRQYPTPHIVGQNHNIPLPAAVASTTPRPRVRHEANPHTPVTVLVKASSGTATKWTPNTTEYTPQSHKEHAQPAYEPLSPVLATSGPQRGANTTSKTPKGTLTDSVVITASDKSTVKPASPKTRVKATSARTGRRRADSTASSMRALSARSTSVMSHADELSLDNDGTTTKFFKQESATPRPFEDMDASVLDSSNQDERLSNRRRGLLGSPRRSGKRKRETSTLRASPSAATHVAFTRNFPKISASAIEHIGAHRNANLFALPLKERDAPGYKDIILRPQDLKSIRSAIVAGNKAGNTILATMEDSGAPYVNLPWSEDLVPPKGIVNNAQLEKELVRMFANAIMYNPDLKRGVGPAFERDDESTDEKSGPTNMDGYEVDEDGIVKDTKVMFADVEKIVSEMRVAERRATESITSADVSEEEEDDVDELAGDETVDRKRRRRL